MHFLDPAVNGSLWFTLAAALFMWIHWAFGRKTWSLHTAIVALILGHLVLLLGVIITIDQRGL